MTGYYLLDNPNPGAVANPDGTYWGRQVMAAPPIWITVHTAESFADLIGDDLGAENVAAYFARSTTAASYHTLVDSDSVVSCLPSGLDDHPVHVAYHCANRNTGNLGISFACRSSEWPTMPADYRRRMLANGADVVARWIRAHDIPLRRVTLAEVDAGVPGITGHGIVQPEDRSDPGLATVFAPSLFPWDEFFELVIERLDGGEDKDMPALLCNIDGSIYGCFADGIWRMLGGAEYAHWSSKGVAAVSYTAAEWSTLRSWGRVA